MQQLREGEAEIFDSNHMPIGGQLAAPALIAPALFRSFIYKVRVMILKMVVKCNLEFCLLHFLAPGLFVAAVQGLL